MTNGTKPYKLTLATVQLNATIRRLREQAAALNTKADELERRYNDLAARQPPPERLR